MKTKSRLTQWLIGSGMAGVAAVVLCAGFLNASPNRGYVAHEWGTFTSVQGGDGALLNWRPLETSRLPGFVYNWTKAGLQRQSLSGPGFAKDSSLVLQRMETPVIYFYSEQGRTVDVSVRFPKGRITEWYPQARQIGPSFVATSPAVAKADRLAYRVGARPDFTFESLLNSSATKESRALWAQVEILKPAPDMTRSLAADRSGSHYFAARETDANFLQVNSLSSTNPAPEIEKFLFYRGVGNFSTPLFVSTTADRTVTISNMGTEPIDHLYLLGVENKAGAFTHIPRLEPGARRTMALGLVQKSYPIQRLARDISEDVVKSLVSEGLYLREAKAMVNTWKDSWFEENGLRVLYILPRAWTDRILPIKLDPAPHELVRVMVGRAEVIPPDQQDRLSSALTRASAGDVQAREQIIDEFKNLGRFSEPALGLATRNQPKQINETAWNLLRAANSAGNETKPL